MDLVLHELDGGHAVANIGPIVCRIINTAPTTPARLDELATHIGATLARSPVAGLWIVAHHDAPIPDRPTRRYAGRVFDPFKDRLSVAYALLGLGFWSSAAVAASLALSKFMGVRATIETSVERSAEQLCMDLIGVDPARLVAVHSDLLARIEAASRESSR